jgi:hypothetical protein
MPILKKGTEWDQQLNSTLVKNMYIFSIWFIIVMVYCGVVV